MTIAVLSWGSPLTLTQSLQSYADFGLDQLDDERLIYFQEITGEDVAIAHKFGWKYIGSTDNVGIAEGYRRLLDQATGEFFLFLENDWKLVEQAETTIRIARNVLTSSHNIDLIRLRHRFNPGSPLWTRQFENHEMDHPTHLLDSIHWTDPSRFEPIKTMWAIGQTYYYTDSKHANWTNNPHMAYTKFLRENIAPHLGRGDLERDIQSWWEQQDFRVAQSKGLFTHERID